MTHPAILKVQTFYDDPDIKGRDLEPHEHALVGRVKRVRDSKLDVYKSAQRVFGDIPKQYRACLIAADETERLSLDEALADFERDVDALDQLEEVEFAMAEAAE